MGLDHLAARTGGLSAGPARSLLPERVPVTVFYIGVPISVGYVAHVHSSGLVCRIGVLESSGHEKVDMAALHVVERWRFQPKMLEGKPVESYYTGAFTYRPLP